MISLSHFNIGPQFLSRGCLSIIFLAFCVWHFYVNVKYIRILRCRNNCIYVVCTKLITERIRCIFFLSFLYRDYMRKMLSVNCV